MRFICPEQLTPSGRRMVWYAVLNVIIKRGIVSDVIDYLEEV
jgi:hypothetical protein